MKKKLMALSALFGIALFCGSVALAYQGGGASQQTDAARNQVLLRVYNADAVEHTEGTVVVWYDGTTADGLEVSTTVTANNGLVAGVVPDNYTLPASGWGFIQTSGYHPAIKIQETATAGYTLVTSTTGEKAGIYTVAQSTGTAATESRVNGSFGVALETTSGSTVKGFIFR